MVRLVLTTLIYSHHNRSIFLFQQYRPTPGLPKELNNWLEIVQRHKDDFSQIREAAENYKKEERHLSEELREKSDVKRVKYNLIDLQTDKYL